MTKTYNLESRTAEFARDCRAFVRKLVADYANIEDSKQLVRASGSTAANYIEANEALSRKDFIMRLKISRKEAKESGLWLRLIQTSVPELISEKERLMGESQELLKIFSSIINKSES